MPTEGYFGAYMIDLAKEIIAQQGDRFLKMPENEAVPQLGQIGLERVLGSIRSDLETLGVNFDVWFSEKSLYQNSQYQRVMDLLKRADTSLRKRAPPGLFYRFRRR